MSFETLVKERYSARGFTNQPVEKEKVGKLLAAAQAAPTACNFQPQRIYVLQSPEALAKVRKCTPYHFEAPLVFLICCNKDEAWVRKADNASSAEIDGAIVTTHIMLQAAELGLGTTWVGSFSPEKVTAEFALPGNLVPVALLPAGYPAAQPSPMHSKRKPLNDTVVCL